MKSGKNVHVEKGRGEKRQKENALFAKRIKLLCRLKCFHGEKKKQKNKNVSALQ